MTTRVSPNPFDLLPNEILYQICQQWDTKTLDNMSKVYPRVRSVCNDLITPFSDLPDKLLYQLCQKLDTPTLLNMSEAYPRIHQVCSDIIQRRKKSYPKILIPGTTGKPFNSTEWIKLIVLRPINKEDIEEGILSESGFILDSDPLYVYLDGTVKNVRRILAGRYYYPPHKSIIEFWIDGQWTTLPLDETLRNLGFLQGETYDVRFIKPTSF